MSSRDQLTTEELNMLTARLFGSDRRNLGARVVRVDSPARARRDVGVGVPIVEAEKKPASAEELAEFYEYAERLGLRLIVEDRSTARAGRRG